MSYTKQQVWAALEAARNANRGWHSDVGPNDYIVPFLRALGQNELAEVVENEQQDRFG